MKFQILFPQKTALLIAIENRNIDIVKLLISYPQIDININVILIFTY